MGTHFSFSIYSENHGVQAEQLNFSRSSDITYVLWYIYRYMDSTQMCNSSHVCGLASGTSTQTFAIGRKYYTLLCTQEAVAIKHSSALLNCENVHVAKKEERRDSIPTHMRV